MFESWDKLPFTVYVHLPFTAQSARRAALPCGFEPHSPSGCESLWPADSATWPPWASEASPRGSRSMPQP